MRQWMKVFYSVVLMIVCFGFIENVNAESIECFYSGQFTIIDGTGGDIGANNKQTFAVGINYDCNGSKKCSAKYAASAVNSLGVSKEVKFKNSDKISENLKEELYDGNTLRCPSYVAISYSGNNSSKGYYFYYSCPNGEAGNGQCIGVFSKLGPVSVPDGNSLEEKVKKITDNGYYQNTPGNQNTTPSNDGNVYANEYDPEADSASINSIRKRIDSDSKEETKTGLEGETPGCSALLGDFAVVLKEIFFWICVAGVVLLIVLMSGDFVKAITSGEADAMADAFKKSLKRIISTIILLLLPVVVNLIIDVLNQNLYTENGSIKFGNVSECNIYE